MNGTLPAPAWMAHCVGPSIASRSGDMARACSGPKSMASSAGAVMTAGPVMNPRAIISRRVTGAPWLISLMGSSIPSVRGGLWLRMIMSLAPLLNQRDAATENGAARCFHDGARTAARASGGTGKQLVDQSVEFRVDDRVIGIPLEAGVLAP